jgi:hypothetical protein
MCVYWLTQCLVLVLHSAMLPVIANGAPMQCSIVVVQLYQRCCWLCCTAAAVKLLMLQIDTGNIEYAVY